MKSIITDRTGFIGFQLCDLFTHLQHGVIKSFHCADEVDYVFDYVFHLASPATCKTYWGKLA